MTDDRFLKLLAKGADVARGCVYAVLGFEVAVLVGIYSGFRWPMWTIYGEIVAIGVSIGVRYLIWFLACWRLRVMGLTRSDIQTKRVVRTQR